MKGCIAGSMKDIFDLVITLLFVYNGNIIRALYNYSICYFLWKTLARKWVFFQNNMYPMFIDTQIKAIRLSAIVSTGTLALNNIYPKRHCEAS